MQRLNSTDEEQPRQTIYAKANGDLSESPSNSSPVARHLEHFEHDEHHYRVYKRRFWGLAQLVLLNIIVSWDWLTFAAISTTAANFFNVSEGSINWLSTGFLFAFLPVAPLVIWTLNKSGPKLSILVSSVLVLVGNWIRYAGTRSSPPQFGIVMFGQILIGFAQPFVLAAPTRYSNLWFSDKGRVSATAIASLANPFGAALGQLVSPLWATELKEIPNMVLYTSILSTLATFPSAIHPQGTPYATIIHRGGREVDLKAALVDLPKNVSFWLAFVPFSVYVGFFNASSSLINQIFAPYGFTEANSGIAGALLILVGLVSAAIVSPIVDRTKKYVLVIKLLVPLIALSYLILVFMPGTIPHTGVGGPWAICAVLGATSFSLLPCALEYLALVTHPISPELSSTSCWTMGQFLGAIFILIMDALKGGWSGAHEPPKSMIRALVFQALVAWAAVPFVFWLETGKLKRRGITLGS